MKRALVTDRTTGEVAAEVSLGADVSARGAIILPGAPSTSTGAPPVAGRVRVELVLGGWRFDFDVEDADRAALRARATTGHEAHTQRGPTMVRAIIPGRVVAVAVVPGDIVTAGQQLLTVEAMKMQNELRSPRDGTVERVAVGAGATVEPGDLLLVLA
jgi:acetyl/propionyl-CoA carboxylase alpha subunit